MTFASVMFFATNCFAAFPTENKTTFGEEQSKKFGTLGTIDLIGEINSGSALTVSKAFSKFKTDNVKEVIFHLNSPGGDLSSGTKIANSILNAQINDKINVIVYVDHKELCASMCTGVFAVGSVRMAAPDSIWVFHSPKLHDPESHKDDKDFAERETASVANARETLMIMYKSADPEFAEKTLKPYIMGTAEKTDLILTGAQIIDYSAWWFDVMLDN